MARPPLALNSHGQITTRQTSPRPGETGPKQFTARCRYRGYDGVTRQVERRGGSRQAAIRNLQTALDGIAGTPGSEELTPDSRFDDAAAMWLTKITGKRRHTSVRSYRAHLGVIRPALGQLRLRECTPARIDKFMTALEYAGRAANYRRGIRSTVSQVLGMAVLHGAIERNPVRDLDNIEGVPKEPRSMTPDEVQTWLAHLDTNDTARRRDLPDLARFMLGTGQRIGETLAVRWCDLDLDGKPIATETGINLVRTVTVDHTITREKGKGLHRTPVKTEAGDRVVALPEFVVAMLRARRPRYAADTDPVFAAGGKSGPSWRDVSEVTKWIREAADELGWGWLSSHNFRKTYATLLDDSAMTDRAKADTLGQARFLKDVYVGRGQVHPEVAGIVDAAFRTD